MGFFESVTAHKIGQSKKREQMRREAKGHIAANVGGADGTRNEKEKKRERGGGEKASEGGTD